MRYKEKVDMEENITEECYRVKQDKLDKSKGFTIDLHV